MHHNHHQSLDTKSLFFLVTNYAVLKLQDDSPSPTDMMKDLAVSNQEKQDLEYLITTLENDNRFATK